MNRKTHVLGVPFDVVTMDEAVARAEGLLKEKGQHFICTPNPEIVMEARKDAELMSILREADLVVPDGYVVILQKLLQRPNTARFACRSVWQAMT